MRNTSFYITLVLLLVLSLSFTTKSQISVKYEVYDNVFLWGCTYEGNQKGIYANILCVSGGSGNYFVTHNPNIKASKYTLIENDDLEIFIPLNTAMNSIDFTISDSQGAAVSLDDNVKSLLYFAANLAGECQAPAKCTVDDIVHNLGDRIYADFYKAKKTITSSAEISDRNTAYIASEDVTLLAGFTTINLTNFSIEIEPNCQ